MNVPSPAEIGLPAAKYKSWRPSQLEAADFIMDAEKPIVSLCMPTGSGKTGVPPLIQNLTQEKLVVLTATRALQDQYMDEASGCGMVDVRGMSNYRCKDTTHKWSCEVGSEEGCPLYQTNFCPYTAASNAFSASDLGVTNYQFFMQARRAKSSALDRITTLVLDEADEAFDELSRFLSTRFSWSETDEFSKKGAPEKKSGTKLAKWRAWADESSGNLKRYLRDKDEKLTKTEKKRLKDLQQKFWRVANMLDGEWVFEIDPRDGVSFECVWPGKYAKSALYGGFERVVLLSATIRPYTMQLLGMAKADYNFREWPRVFPLNRFPFIHVPTIAMTWRTEIEELEAMVARVDEIIESRLDRKGLIHTKSYARARFLYDHSRYARHMILNDRSTTKDAAEKLRRAKAPAILCSPSYPRGWDFAYTAAEYQIIVKVPFDVTTTQIAKARKKDKRYMLYSTMQELVQMRGRVMRAPDDRGETFCIDNQIEWLEPMARKYAPSWWSMRTLLDVPAPPPKLQTRSAVA